jgi:hypothetical protein
LHDLAFAVEVVPPHIPAAPFRKQEHDPIQVELVLHIQFFQLEKTMATGSTIIALELLKATLQ